MSNCVETKVENSKASVTTVLKKPNVKQLNFEIRGEKKWRDARIFSNIFDWWIVETFLFFFFRKKKFYSKQCFSFDFLSKIVCLGTQYTSVVVENTLLEEKMISKTKDYECKVERKRFGNIDVCDWFTL